MTRTNLSFYPTILAGVKVCSPGVLEVFLFKHRSNAISPTFSDAAAETETPQRMSSLSTVVSLTLYPVERERAMLPLRVGESSSSRRSSLRWSLTSSRSSSFRSSSNVTSSAASGRERRIVQWVYAMAMFSWMVALYHTGQAESHIAHWTKQSSELSRDLEQLHSVAYQRTKQFVDARNEYNTMVETRAALVHEQKVLTEFINGDFQLLPHQTEAASSWLKRRQDTLQKRLHQLQHYLQEYSREKMTEKYGSGPHRLRFNVQIDPQQDTIQSFVVELDSRLPHSSLFFLDMVRLHIWDNTVLLHHEQVEHVIAGVPLDYDSKKVKHHHMAHLGWTNLGFLEYEPETPHQKYTIGFANRGPTFYINTMNNTETHGPGGQDHHKLDGEADPCFAKVVEGTEVVDLMMEAEKHNVFEEGHPWFDEENGTSKLVSIELLY